MDAKLLKEMPHEERMVCSAVLVGQRQVLFIFSTVFGISIKSNFNAILKIRIEKRVMDFNNEQVFLIILIY